MDLDELASEAGSQSDAEEEEEEEEDDDAGSDFSESPAVESRTATPKTRSVPSRASTSARRQSSSTAPAPASISNEAQPKSLNGGFKIKLKVNAAAAPSPKTAATTALPSFRFGQATHPTVSAPVASTSRATPSTAPSLPAKRQRKQAQVDGGNCPLSLLDHLLTKLARRADNWSDSDASAESANSRASSSRHTTGSASYHMTARQRGKGSAAAAHSDVYGQEFLALPMRSSLPLFSWVHARHVLNVVVLNRREREKGQESDDGRRSGVEKD